MTILVGTLRPYKVDLYNTVDSVFLVIFALYVSFYAYSKLYEDLSLVYINVLLLTPFVYIIGYVTIKVLSFVVRKCRSPIAKRMKSSITQENDKQENNDQLPHHLLKPSVYTHHCYQHHPHIESKDMQSQFFCEGQQLVYYCVKDIHFA